jgi:hypothetical protein
MNEPKLCSFLTATQVTNTIRAQVFNQQHYLMPIPQSEIAKMPSMVQNPRY